MATATATAQTFVVTARKEIITFTSTLSDQKVYDILSTLRSAFAVSLLSKWGKLSDAQYAWAHKLAVDADTETAVDSDNSYSFEQLFSVFRIARQSLKRVKLRLETFNLSISQDLQSIWVTSATEMEEGRYGLQPKYLGKITANRIADSVPDDIKTAILAVANDPLSAAVRYGKTTGNCSCCGRTLTDPVSVEAGIGPICKTKWGM
jgi:hypothetical protein